MWFVLSRRATVWILWDSDGKPELVWGVRKGLPVVMMDSPLRDYLRGDKGVHRIQGRKGDMCSCPGAGEVAMYSRSWKKYNEGKWIWSLTVRSQETEKGGTWLPSALWAMLRILISQGEAIGKGDGAANQDHIPPKLPLIPLRFGSQRTCCRKVEVVKTCYVESVFHLTNIMSLYSVAHTVLGPRVKKMNQKLTDHPS